MGEKSRGNFTTGGWCKLRKDCVNDGVACSECLDYSEFEEQAMKVKARGRKERNKQ